MVSVCSCKSRSDLQITCDEVTPSPEYINNCAQLNRKNTNRPGETWAKDFTKEDMCVARKCRRKMVNCRWLGGNLFLPKSLWSRSLSLSSDAHLVRCVANGGRTPCVSSCRGNVDTCWVEGLFESRFPLFPTKFSSRWGHPSVSSDCHLTKPHTPVS